MPVSQNPEKSSSIPVRLAHRIAAARGEFGCVREVPSRPCHCGLEEDFDQLDDDVRPRSVRRPAARRFATDCPHEGAYTLMVNSIECDAKGNRGES